MNKILIQIGAAEGNDHVAEILKDEDITGILVEPNLKNFNILKQNYQNRKNVFFENIAISTRKDKIKIFFESNSEVSYHGSMNYMHLLMHGHDPANIDSFEIDALSLSNLIEKYNLINTEIEYLFIDTEGHDCDIILSTDFSKFNIKNICFECTHADSPFKQGEKLHKTIKHLESFGYTVNTNMKIDYSLWMNKQ